MNDNPDVWYQVRWTGVKGVQYALFNSQAPAYLFYELISGTDPLASVQTRTNAEVNAFLVRLSA